MAALTVIDGFLEWAGIISIIVALTFFGIYLAKKSKASACNIDCECNEESSGWKRIN
jgi:hypothetical protein